MKRLKSLHSRSLPQLTALGLASSIFLSACGGSSPSATNTVSPASEINPTQVVSGILDPVQAQSLSTRVAEPTYHLLPVLPALPDAIDADGQSRSANMAPQRTVIPAQLQGSLTKGLTAAKLLSNSIEAGATVSPSTSTTPVPVNAAPTYRPAQIRAAYGLPALPSNMNNLTPTQAAQLGAGQTIYIIDAYHDLYAYGELIAFSQLFGLPSCNQKSLAANASLPLPAPTANSCDFYQVYATAAGSMTATAPAYNAGWATEVAMDIEWAHATAPLARIVLIEGVDATLGSLTGAIALANKMGSGVVSMSFAGAETSSSASLDTYFKAPGMSYFASTGDNGSAVNWPAVSQYVVAVGGTSLQFSGTGNRTETVWSGTGGGLSAFVPTPGYQQNTVPGIGSPAHRAVADVAFNADPTTGQFVATIPNQTTCTICFVSWVGGGGTSISVPQWAGIAAVANAMRIQGGKAMLGDPHSFLYSQIGAVTATYSNDFLDVTSGNNGSCSVCVAKTGYDTPTGLGSPKGVTLLNSLAGFANAAVAPVVTGATINGMYGNGLGFTVAVTDVNSYTLSMSGAPAGMVLASTGTISWANPVPGSYNITVTAKDSKTGLTGQGVYTVIIAPPPPPTVAAGNISGLAGKALSFSVAVGDVYPCTLTMTGAPAGMTINNAGLVSWSNPVGGIYNLVITAKDQKTGLSGSGTYTVIISSANAPAVGGGSISVKSGSAMNFNVSVVNSNPYTLSLSGAPAGMSINGSGTISWANPVAGSYKVTVAAKDSKTGAVGVGLYTFVVSTTAGPQISDTPLIGSVNKAFSAVISITDANSSIVGVGIGGAPNGMSVSPQGGNFSNMGLSWTKPVAGTYTLQIYATDAAGQQAASTVQVMISAQ